MQQQNLSVSDASAEFECQYFVKYCWILASLGGLRIRREAPGEGEGALRMRTRSGSLRFLPWPPSDLLDPLRTQEAGSDALRGRPHRC
jgi:hypothetical protein